MLLSIACALDNHGTSYVPHGLVEGRINLINMNSSTEEEPEGAYAPFYASNPVKYIQDTGNWFEVSFMVQ